MIEVFTTNVQGKAQAERILGILSHSFPTLKINFDLSETVLPYPCGHSILRVEGTTINSEKIIAVLRQSGLICEILENKVCN
ncbi:hypothetical protein [Dyadobacter tibetensis]|uniref:hypothetical protein n=1 Tax=Dyadobacter tibetensis TaxID=1211851 RepID=UPI000A0267CD|nr:hypothetical protein [Dyadobacter tibetensis]